MQRTIPLKKLEQYINKTEIVKVKWEDISQKQMRWWRRQVRSMCEFKLDWLTLWDIKEICPYYVAPKDWLTMYENFHRFD